MIRDQFYGQAELWFDKYFRNPSIVHRRKVTIKTMSDLLRRVDELERKLKDIERISKT